MDFSTSGRAHNPVLLEITSVNQEEGTGTCVNVYAGFMSEKRIYARLTVDADTEPSPDCPKYIRVKKGKTGGNENYRYIPECDFSAIVRTLDCPEGTILNKDKRVYVLKENDPAVAIINKVWPADITSQALSAAS